MPPEYPLAERVVCGLFLLTLLFCTVAFKIWKRNREANDPELAARVDRIRAHMQRSGSIWGWEFAANRIIWVLGAIAVIAANAAVDKYAITMHWSGQQKVEIILAVIACMVVLGIFASRVVNRWLRARGLIRTP